MRYSLRTLLILMALGPPLMGAGWWGWGEYQEWQEWRERERQASELRAVMDGIFRTWESSGGGMRSLPRDSPAAKLLKDMEAAEPNQPATVSAP